MFYDLITYTKLFNEMRQFSEYFFISCLPY